MDAGRCVEFGAPYELLTDEQGTGIFYEMVKKTGKSMFDNLLAVAKQVIVYSKASLLFPFVTKFLFFTTGLQTSSTIKCQSKQ